MNKTPWTKEQIKANLETQDSWVSRGIVAIFKLQTDAEKAIDQTTDNNDIGFNGVDAELLSGFAKWINSGKKLTKNQMVYARKKILKYAGQLCKIANGEIKVTA